MNTRGLHVNYVRVGWMLDWFSLPYFSGYKPWPSIRRMQFLEK